MYHRSDFFPLVTEYIILGEQTEIIVELGYKTGITIFEGRCHQREIVSKNLFDTICVLHV